MNGPTDALKRQAKQQFKSMITQILETQDSWQFSIHWNIYAAASAMKQGAGEIKDQSLKGLI